MRTALDAMVIGNEPTFPGCLIECRVIAMFRMTDEMGGDDKLLCIPTADLRRNHLQDITDVPEYMLLEIEHFFTVYKDLEPGKSVEGATWTGRAEAEADVVADRGEHDLRACQGHGLRAPNRLRLALNTTAGTLARVRAGTGRSVALKYC